jgi:hypothetical protein
LRAADIRGIVFCAWPVPTVVVPFKLPLFTCFSARTAAGGALHSGLSLP